MPGKKPLFKKAAIIGIGHIGASLALDMRGHKLVGTVVAGDKNNAHLKTALKRKIAHQGTANIAVAVKDADLVVLAVPVASMGKVARTVAKHLKKGAIVTDVGSVKKAVVDDVARALPKHVFFVPAHPIAGTEFSGPEAGLTGLFEGRWCILTPLKNQPAGYDAAVSKIERLWSSIGAKVERMDPAHHDRVLAITSHLPHLIAYTIVSTAADLGGQLKSEVIRFSASGFRDFTRIASSDPVMWRDIFLNNREAVLEVIQQFSEDLTALQRAIRWGEGAKLEKLFTQSRALRKKVLQENKAADAQLAKNAARIKKA